MKNYRITASLSICLLVATGTYAQDGAKAKDIKTTRIDQTTVLKTEKKEAAYSSEKKVAGKTVQVYTKDQFDKLPKDRKEYYLAHPSLCEITSQKDN